MITKMLKGLGIIGGVFFFVHSGWGIEFSTSYLAQIAKDYGEYPKRRLIAWQKLTQENRQLNEKKKLILVNNFFNAIEYRSDQSHWGVADYWSTPLELLVSGAGDCEDFTTAKYFTLLDLGVADEKLLIKYVHLTHPYHQAHMVLFYYATPESIPLVLDNFNKKVLPANKRVDLKPIYGFNHSGLWQACQLGKGKQIGQASDLKRWNDLKARIKSGKIAAWKEEEDSNHCCDRECYGNNEINKGEEILN